MKIEQRLSVMSSKIDDMFGYGDELYAIATELAALLRDMQASDVWAEGRGSRTADVLYMRMCSLLDGEER